MIYTVAVYHRDGLAYGGPEEGGWWYDTASLVRLAGTYSVEERATAQCRQINDELRESERDVRPVSSVAYAGGRHYATVVEGTAPMHVPEHRPHYE